MANKPNVVVLMADEMRFDCLSCYGDLGVRTPHMDALANESVVFDRAYCASPLCVPARTAIAAGKWPHRTGVIVNGSHSELERPFSVLGPEHRTYLEQLEDAGYRIAHVGVQHMKGLPQRLTGARFVGEREYVDYLNKKGLKPAADDSARRPCPDFVNGKMIVKGYYPATFVRKTEFGADDFMDVYWSRVMCESIREADLSQPNAWIFNGWAPHPPAFVPEPYFSMYDPEAIRLPANVAQWYAGQPPFLLHTTSAKGVQLKADDWRKMWAAYFGLVTMVDDCMGRVIAALKERGVWDDALVIFTMDHGECLGAHSLWAKQVMYEESARIPLMIKPPGGRTGRRTQIANQVDLAATICEYAGVEAPAGHQGRSLKAAVENAAAAWHEATFADYHGEQGRGYPSRAIFTERYKYIFHFCGPDELYDVIADPLETKSLATEPEFQPLKHELRGHLAQWMRETGDVFDMERDANFTPQNWPEVGLRFSRPREVI